MEPDDLYGVPLEEFTAARNAVAKLRPEAKALRKPTIAAWAVNQLARRHRGELESFLEAARGLREVQLGGEGDLQAATRAERDGLRRLLQLAGEYAGSGQIEPIRQTLQAAAVSDEAAEQVRAGRLERELEPAGFGSLLQAAPSTRKRKAAGGAKREDARRAKRIAEAEQEERQARAAAREAEQAEAAARREWERLREAAERARSEADEAARRLREARG